MILSSISFLFNLIMNTSRLVHFLFQGNLVKRIAIGLILGLLVALVNPSITCSSTDFDFLPCYGSFSE